MSPGPGPGYPHQGQYMGSTMATNTPRYMMGQVRSGHMPPMPSHAYSQQVPSQHPMSFSPSMPSQTSQLPSQQQQQQQQQLYHGQPQQPQPPGHPPPQSSPTPSQQQPHHSLPPSSSASASSSHRPPSSQGASPRQLSPAPPGMADQNSDHSTSSRKSEENTEPNRENSHSEEVKGESENTVSSQGHLGLAGVRPVPSPAGSTGSRCDTPASNSGTQAGSPMPPRPPSSQLESQGHNSQSPMATQGYSQQMMPPPMGGQMGYPVAASGGKMGSGPPGMTSSQMAPHYAQYGPQYPQAASVGSSSAPGLTTSANSSSSGEMLSSSSQTSSSMPLMMNSSTNCNNPPATSIPNGPHYPHSHHPHPALGGYSMGGPGMSGSHMMGGPGMPHHPGMQHPMGGPHMPPYSVGPSNMPSNNMGCSTMGPGHMGPNSMPSSNMPSNMPPNGMAPGSGMSGNMPPQGSGMPGSMLHQVGMPSNMPPQGSMPPNSMPGNMPPNSMPGNMPPNSMPGNMPPGAMMNNMQHPGAMPGNMPPGMGMPPQQGAMPNSMSRGSMANHMPAGSMAANMPPGNNLGANGKGHCMGPMNMPAQNSTTARASGPPDDPPEKKKKDEGVMVGAGPSLCEDNENCSGPGWPGMPKASDMTKLYDMGGEMDRRPFLDKLLAFLEEKGSPVTTMPNISKQPLDLYKLYHCVREKGGFVEVNKAKRWKELCTFVNIGCSASAAFTLKKNYIKYLFAFECKFDLGGVDPAPILAELETHGDRKREKKRVPSPGSQSSQDTFQSASGPNSQMMDGYHGGGGGIPPPFMQGTEGQMMGGQGPGSMMMPNMMAHPNMMGGPPHHQGSGPGPGMMGHGPNSMMVPSGQGMMGGGMVPQGGMMNSATGMMGPGGMHMGSNSYGPGPHSMLGGSNSSMGPSPGPHIGGNSNSTISLSPGPLPNTTANSSVGTADTATVTSNSVALPPSTTPNSRPPTADSVSIQDPFSDEPGKSSSPATFQSRPGGPLAPSPTPGGYPSPGPPTTSSTGYGSRPSSNSNPNAVAFPNGPGAEAGPNAFRRSSESFPPNNAGPFLGRTDGAQYSFGQENSSHSGQPFRPPSANPDTSFAPRFPSQQAAFRANGPGEAYSNSYPNHTSGVGQRLPGQEGFSAFPSSQHPGVRPGLNRDGSYPAQAGYMNPVWDWNGVGSWGQSLPHPDTLSDYSASGRDGDRWSPMSSRSFPPNTPGTPSVGSYGRPTMRGSPQPRDKVLAAKLQQKTCAMLPNAPFQPKKEIVFPPDSVEATQPTLSKRRRLTHKDISPVEAWRLMMALKSGMLAESTWAIDTLNILLFDDATVTYFNLNNLPGLLEVLTEHFRASLLHIFHNLGRQELHSMDEKESESEHLPSCENGRHEGGRDTDIASLIKMRSEVQLEKALCCTDYTWVSRQGRGVVKDQVCGDRAVLDPKLWDRHCNFVSGRRHWLKGGGDITCHVVPGFESGQSQQFLTDTFYLNRTSRKEGVRKRSAAHGAVCQNGPKRPCIEKCPFEKDRCKGSMISPCSGGNDLCDHSKVCSQHVVHQNSVPSCIEVKQEDCGLHCCQSQDSLPPPLLSHSGEDSQVSNEDVVKSSAGHVKESGDKISPPQLTNEEEKTKLPASQNTAPDQEKETSENCESDTLSQGVAAPKEEEDEMTAEIVAMMIKEQDKEMEEEAYRPDDPPLTTVQSDQEEMGQRCVAISNIFRSLSCIPGNEKLLAKHHGLMWLLGQLLLLHHSHPVRCKPPPAPPLEQQEETKLEEVVGKGESECIMKEVEEGERDWATCTEWWWETLEALRENALVILANICSHMHMRDMASEVCMPILDGLLHWMVCPSSAACDPLPSASSTSQLSPQRLVLEALCKLCIHEENVDLVLATPPFSRILLLLERLIRLLAERSQPVPREFSIALLSRLVQGDGVAARAIALQHPSIPLLIEFLESAEQSAMAAAGQQGIGAGVQSNPEALGTSLDMLRRAASTLLQMARLPHNRKLFLHHQCRLLSLVMSQWLDSGVTKIISDVLFECSQFEPHPT